MVPDPESVVGVDLGGSNVSAVLTAADGSCRHRSRRSHQVHDLDSALAALHGVVQDVVQDVSCRPVAAVGLAVAGWLSPRRDCVRHALNLGLRDVALPGELAAVLGAPVVMVNDADAAAFAEYRATDPRPRCLLSLSLGTGLGAGVVLNGRVLTGARGLAGELGHQQTRADGPPCVCGGTGCAELYASGGGIAARARERFDWPTDAAGIVAAAAAGDGRASALLEDAGRTVGALVATAVPLLDPDLVVIGGGFGVAAAHLLLPSIHDEIHRRRSMTPVSSPPPVRISALGAWAAATGAAHLTAPPRGSS